MVSMYEKDCRFARAGADELQDGENYDRWLAYGQSKTANILHAISLARKLGPRRLTAISLHPGVIKTNLSTHVDWEKEFKDLRTSVPHFYRRIIRR